MEDASGRGEKRVETVLRGATRIVSVRVLHGDRTSEDTLAGHDPLSKWVFPTRVGLLQAEGEGCCDADKLSLEEE